MVIFLTSSPTIGWGGDLNPANGFLDELRKAMPKEIRCLMITSYPDDQQITDRMAWELREEFDHADLSFSHYEVLDRRTQQYARRMIKDANFIILCGGHVPTQNKFFKELKLAGLLRGFDGVMMTISAGSMNCADTVYCGPELEGESVDPNFMRFIPGLGLTPINIFPHYYGACNNMLDGQRMEQILLIDSYARPIYCLPDGSWIKINHLHAILYGDAYLMRYGQRHQFCTNDNTRIIY